MFGSLGRRRVDGPRLLRSCALPCDPHLTPRDEPLCVSMARLLAVKYRYHTRQLGPMCRVGVGERELFGFQGLDGGQKMAGDCMESSIGE
jgi:hypothetical protein